MSYLQPLREASPSASSHTSFRPPALLRAPNPGIPLSAETAHPPDDRPSPVAQNPHDSFGDAAIARIAAALAAGDHGPRRGRTSASSSASGLPGEAARSAPYSRMLRSVGSGATESYGRRDALCPGSGRPRASRQPRLRGSSGRRAEARSTTCPTRAIKSCRRAGARVSRAWPAQPRVRAARACVGPSAVAPSRGNPSRQRAHTA